MSQTTTCLCVLAFVTAVGCAEEPATVYPDGGRIGVGVTVPDAGSGGATGSKLDGGLDAGRRDAASTADEDDDVEEVTDDDDSDDDGPQPVDAGTREAFKLSSADVTARALLPEAFTCSNAVSPALSWTPGPAGTQSYAVQLRNTEIETGLRSYWLLYDLPGDITEIPGMIPRRPTVEEPPARQALDDSRLGTYGYFGPCTTATLELSVHALDVAELPDIPGDAGAAAISAAISEHELGKATMVVRSENPDETAP